MRVRLDVDPLNDFCPGGSFGITEGDAIVPVLNQLSQPGLYELRVAVRDRHPRGHVSFASSHQGAQLWSSIDVNGFPQLMCPEHCVEGTHGAEFHPDLDTSRYDAIFDKGTELGIDSHSGFYDNQRLHETPLREYLIKEAAKRGETLKDITLDVTGLALDWCVKFTALDAASLGIRTRVVVDATRAANLEPGDDTRALREMAQAGIELIDSRRVLLEAERGRQREQPLQP